MMRRRQAFTLLEMTMAFAVIAIAGLAAAGVAAALSNAYGNSKDYYHCIQTNRVGMLRVADDLRGAELVTDTSDTAMLIWCEDTNDNGRINFSELASVYWDSQSQRVCRDRLELPDAWPAEVKAAYDVVIPLWAATTGSWQFWQATSPYRQTTILAENVEDFRVETTPATPLAETVTVQMTVSYQNRSLTTRNAVTLRAGQIDRVVKIESVYVLP